VVPHTSSLHSQFCAQRLSAIAIAPTAIARAASLHDNAQHARSNRPRRPRYYPKAQTRQGADPLKRPDPRNRGLKDAAGPAQREKQKLKQFMKYG
jgi:hypothetical protein